MSDATAAAGEDRCAQRLALLRELAEIGMGLARGLGQRAQDEPGGADLGLAYAQIARAVRQTLALEARFEDEAKSEHLRQASARGAAAKREARRLVQRAIDTDPGDRNPYVLGAHLNERLRDEDDADFADRPLVEIVARICADLGVAFDPELWDDLPDPAAEAGMADAREVEAAEPPPARLGIEPWRRAPPFAASG
jgi:hypothetical protein